MQPIFYIVMAEAVIYHQGRYLMIVRSAAETHAPLTLAFPGGKVEGVIEQPAVLEATLRREVREEARVEVGPQLVYIESKAFGTDDGKPVIDVVFLCRYAGGEPAPGDPAEVAAVRWMAPAEVLADPAAPPWTRQTLRLAEARRIELGWA